MAKKCKKCSGKSGGIGGFGDANAEQAAGAAAGALAASLINKKILSKLDSDPSKMLGANPKLGAAVKAGIKAAAGFYLMGMDNEVAKGAGAGMIAFSAFSLGRALMPNVIGELGTPPQRYIAGYNHYGLGTGLNTIGEMHQQEAPGVTIEM